MIKKFYIFENTLYSSLSNITNENELEKLIGLEPDNYELTIGNKNDSFELSVKAIFLERFLNLEDGIFNWIFNVSSNYSNYEFYVDDSELDFIINFLTDENISKLKKVAKFLDVDDIIDNQEIYNMFIVLGNDLIDYRDIIYEIAEARELVVRKDVNKILKELPIKFENTYVGEWDIDILFNIEKIGEYIEKNNLKDINTVSDFLENVDFSNLSYELENIFESEFGIDYTETNKVFGKAIDELIEKMNITEEKYNDPNQLKLFNDEFEDPKYNFDFNVFSKIEVNRNNIYIANNLGGKLLGWFKSYIFQKNYMKDKKLEKYTFLKDLKIIHPIIEEEYEYLDTSIKYNL